PHPCCSFSSRPCTATLLSFLSLRPPPPRSPLFPYTTLFRSVGPHAPLHVFQCGHLWDAFGGGGGNVPFQSVFIERIPDGGQLHEDRKSTRLNSSHVSISYAVFCLTKKRTPHVDTSR